MLDRSKAYWSFIVAIHLPHMQSYFNHTFIVSLSHSCNYFFLSHLFSTVVLAFVLFSISCLVLSSVIFLFFLSSAFSIWICWCSPHLLFSVLFLVLFVLLLRSWCFCGHFLLSLLIFFLLLFMVTIHNVMVKHHCNILYFLVS